MNSYSFLQPNWLAHKINNAVVRRHCHMLKGVVVDLGCGKAPYRREILEHAERYIGVDWPQTRHGAEGVDVFANIQARLPFPDASVDNVVSFQTMEHLNKPASFLAECFRILKPNGLLFITVPFMWHVHEAPQDFFRYTRYGITHLLVEQGFSQIRVDETTGFWQMFALKFNYHTARRSSGFLRFFWIPFWWLGQAVSPWLDRIDPHPEETAGYTVLSRKPQ